MSRYQLYRELMHFTIVKDGDMDWAGKFHFTPSGFGFEANDSEGGTFRLVSSGMLFWRKLTLIDGHQEVDRFSPYRSRKHDVVLKRGRDIFLDGRDAFSFSYRRELTEHGMRIASWEYPLTPYERTIYTLVLLREQGRRPPGTAM
ncbi:hypothetical protein FV139_14535 [Parahaliea maris]|uniref:Uncharacterized protein n=1 Tax=Parahaliea maris TaxID=2716870 RepID=A0A5C8ZWK7_9GAMM|nr:hypothetical protein [Parahaliea maris]TXS91940.1 hypothetical protein FV139_14535 [Parahaliea maris]